MTCETGPVCLKKGLVFLLLLIGAQTIFSEDIAYPIMVRSVCRGPTGVDRFGFGHFLEFEFGERIDGPLPELQFDKDASDGCFVVSRPLKTPYFGCEEAELRYDAVRHRLFNIRLYWRKKSDMRPLAYCRDSAKIAAEAKTKLGLPLIESRVVKEEDFSKLKIGACAVRYVMSDKSFTVVVEVRKETGGRADFFVSVTSHSVLMRQKASEKTSNNLVEIDI